MTWDRVGWGFENDILHPEAAIDPRGGIMENMILYYIYIYIMYIMYNICIYIIFILSSMYYIHSYTEVSIGRPQKVML